MILIHPSIDPVILSFGYLEIRWYSLAYIISFLLGLYLVKYFNQKNKNKISGKKIENFFFFLGQKKVNVE